MGDGGRCRIVLAYGNLGAGSRPNSNAAGTCRQPSRRAQARVRARCEFSEAYKPGEFWPLTFTPEQKKTVTTLADVMFPADHLGPAASEVGVPEMVDEWISAPYPQQQADRPVILEGLAWLDTEAEKRWRGPFFSLSLRDLHGICDDICHTSSAKPEFIKAAHFFARFRSLCAGAYYATPAGWKAIGYVGNVPLERFEGPPAEVLEKLGVTQTVQ